MEAVLGRVGPDGDLEDTSVLTLQPVGEHDGMYLFEREFVPHQTGRLGYTLRVWPNHCDDPLARPCYAQLKWAGE